MADSSAQQCSSVSNMAANSPLPPKFLALMKSAERAKFEGGKFTSRIDLLARQYAQGFDEILRQGSHENRDEVIREIATEMDVEASRYIPKLEDFRAKLKNGWVDQEENTDGGIDDRNLPADSHVRVQECMLKLQQEIRSMADSFMKRLEDATVRDEERKLEITALKKQLAEALESNGKLKGDMTQIPVPPVVATVDQGVQTYGEDFLTLCNQLDEEMRNLMNRYEEHKDSLETVKEELLREIRILDAKMKICEQACSPSHLTPYDSLSDGRMLLCLTKFEIEASEPPQWK